MDLAELHEIAEKERRGAEAGARSAAARRRAACRPARAGVKQALDAGRAGGRPGRPRRRSAASAACGCAARGRWSRSIPRASLYEQVTPEQAPRRSSPRSTAARPTARRGDPDSPFFARQMPIVLENSGRIEPERIESYIAAGGYQALYQVLREMTPGRGGRGDHAQRPARPRRRGLSDRPEVGDGGQDARRRASTSSATPTRATPAPSWTAASWRATRTASSKAWPSPATPSGPARATSTSAASTRWPSAGCETAIKQAKRLGLLGSQRLRLAVRLPHRRPHRRRGLRLRRGDGADGLDRGRARHAAAAAALPGRVGPVGLPDAHQQRRDVRQHPGHHPRGRRLVRRASAPRRARGPRSSR